MKTADIHQPVTLQLADEHREPPYAATLIYRPSDPYAVQLTLPRHNGAGAVSVLFGRALLIDGLEDVAGDGDVLIRPHIVNDWITLTVPVDGWPTEYLVRRDALEGFVDRTFGAVNLGRESAHFDLDALAARLLDERAGRRGWLARMLGGRRTR